MKIIKLIKYVIKYPSLLKIEREKHRQAEKEYNDTLQRMSDVLAQYSLEVKRLQRIVK